MLAVANGTTLSRTPIGFPLCGEIFSLRGIALAQQQPVHAGDPDVMAATVKLAKEHNVAVGAHPRYPDLRWFGRRPMRLTPEEIVNLILTQVGALWAIARSQ